MKVIFVCKEYFQTEDEKVYFFEPLEKEISIEDMQKIMDANEKIVKEVEDAKDDGYACPICGGWFKKDSGHSHFQYVPPTLNREEPCLWDSMPETSPGSGVKIGMLSCPCPKCSPRC